MSAAPGLNEITTTTLRSSPMREAPKSKAGKAAKVGKVMKEFKGGKLHSGSKKGPKVTNPKQAVAIAMSESGQSKPKEKYDRDAHFPGNPGFPSSAEAKSPPPQVHRFGPTTPAKGSHGYGHRPGQHSGSYRLSGHAGAHRIGKR